MKCTGKNVAAQRNIDNFKDSLPLVFLRIVLTTLWKKRELETYIFISVRKPSNARNGQCLSVAPSIEIVLNTALHFIIVGFPV